MPENPRFPPGLWVVATPIGNLSDLSARARETLAGVTVILCEDTRRTRALLSGIGLEGARLERLDEHASPRAIQNAVKRMETGASLALVTDAGTPGISDPAAKLVSACRSAGVAVVPVPGPSAVTALISVTGFAVPWFAFRGFFPRRDRERRAELERVTAPGRERVVVWYESPERIVETTDFLADASPGAELVVAKELTKIHERFFSGIAASAARAVRAEVEREGARGEWCLAARFPETEKAESSDWVKVISLLIDAGVSASEAARQVSHTFGVSRSAVYEAALRFAGKKNRGGG